MPAAYDNYDYPSYWTNRDYEHKSEVVALKAFLTKIAKLETVAEIGAGFGRLTPLYSYRARKVYLVDPSAKTLAIARKTFSSDKRIHFIQSTLENTPTTLKTKKFDLILTVRVMHHIPDVEEAIKTLASKLNDGGFLIIEFANKIHLKSTIAHFIKGDFTFPIDITTIDRRSKRMKDKGTISFVNHHPDVIFESLRTNGFDIKEVRSVSNLRNHLAKELIPIDGLIAIESLVQRPMGKLLIGPSIFVLAQKNR